MQDKSRITFIHMAAIITEHRAALTIVAIIRMDRILTRAMVMETARNRKNRNGKESRADLELRLQNAQHWHWYSDWCPA